MQSSNPALRSETFTAARQAARSNVQGVMTIEGTVNKTAVLLALLVTSAIWTWTLAFKTTGYGTIAIEQNPGMLGPWIGIGAIVGLIIALITSFKPQWSPYTAPAYAIFEGLFIGGLSVYMEMRFPGLPMQAAILTFGVFFAMLMAYKARLIRVTEKFRSGMTAAIGGIFLVYLLSWILGMFSIQIPLIHGSGTVGIIFSLVVVGLAALSLVLDFDLIEQGARQGAPKFMEWYGGFALTVTLVWLYVEILRLLSKLNSRE